MEDDEEASKSGSGSTSRTRGLVLFSKEDVFAATDKLSKSKKIDEGLYGTVYKGVLHDEKVSIRVLGREYMLEQDKFREEVNVLRRLRHQNIARFAGVCLRPRALIYKMVPNGSLHDFVKENTITFRWQRRTIIIYQISSALLFLHSNQYQPLFHGSLNLSNIFLDENFDIKLSNFGLGRFFPDIDQRERIKNLEKFEKQYIDPSIWIDGELTPFCDMYSLGVVIFVLLTGNPDANVNVDELREACASNKVMGIVDATAGNWPEDVVKWLAYCCVQCHNRESDSLKLLEEISTGLMQRLNDLGILLQQDEESSDEDEPIISLATLSEKNIIVFKKHDIDIAKGYYLQELGKGGGGTVHKGLIGDEDVAIKILHPNNEHGEDEFRQEVDVLGTVKHKHLVNLLGVCLDPTCLVYEFVPNGSVEDCLANNPGNLNWYTRIRILYQTCLALMCLHSTTPKPIAHGDLKPDNVLLDSDYNAKLADFGLSRLLTGGTTASKAFVETKVAKGTECYIDPDFLSTRKLTPACDVYSFGVMILKLLTAETPYGIIEKVKMARRDKTLMKLVDRKAGDWPTSAAEILAFCGLRCCGKKRIEWLDTMKVISVVFEDILDKAGAKNVVA